MVERTTAPRDQPVSWKAKLAVMAGERFQKGQLREEEVDLLPRQYFGGTRLP
jgi:hypothetical protein